MNCCLEVCHKLANNKMCLLYIAVDCCWNFDSTIIYLLQKIGFNAWIHDHMIAILITVNYRWFTFSLHVQYTTVV